MKNNRSTAWIFILLFSTVAFYLFLKKFDQPIDDYEEPSSTRTASPKLPTVKSKPEPTRKVSSTNPNSTMGLNSEDQIKPKPLLNGQAVVEWLKENENLAHFEFEEDVKLSGNLDSDYTQIYYFQQTYKGYKVFNHHLRVIVKKENQEILRVKNHFYEVPPLVNENFESISTIKQSLTQSLKISPSLLTSNMTDPEVYVQDGKSYLIWRIAKKTVATKEPEQTLFVDAATGKILKSESTRMY